MKEQASVVGASDTVLHLSSVEIAAVATAIRTRLRNIENDLVKVSGADSLAQSGELEDDAVDYSAVLAELREERGVLSTVLDRLR